MPDVQLKTHKYQELISALIDDEISDTHEITEIKEMINNNHFFLQEYRLLYQTKNRVKKCNGYINTPIKIRESILQKIKMCRTQEDYYEN